MTTPTRSFVLLAVLALVALPACGDDGPSSTDTAETDTAVADTGGDDTAVADTGESDTSPADTVAEDTGGTDAAEDTTVADTTADDTVPNDLGFTIRYPQTHHIACDSGTPDFPAEDIDPIEADWLCTFAYGGESGYVYVRATPTGCVVTFSGNPVFDDCAGWIALDGTVSPLTEVGYDWGGNHHNDSITFGWGGKRFTYDHSSFGFGWRACQEVDCLVVHDASGTLVEDGCTVDRTLPAVCRQIAADGTWGSFEDTFAPCAGDPNYR
ncbi:MAG: hypothetical protein EP329_05650 [Deltaproteobacteria bacterium]|nr:MAG: hypothetical protein EP329_05650 [Deltaproteobacteria bacterium]